MEYDEREVEHKLENVESETEQIESQLEELEQQVEELEKAIAELSNKEGSDQAVIASLKGDKEQKEQEVEQVRQKAVQVEAELQQVDARIRVVNEWNDEAISVLRELQSVFPVGDAVQRVSDRARWVDEQDERCSNLRQRVRSILSGHG